MAMPIDAVSALALGVTDAVVGRVRIDNGCTVAVIIGASSEGMI